MTPDLNKYAVEVIDRNTAKSSQIMIEAIGENEARLLAADQSGQLIGSIKRIGRDNSSRRNTESAKRVEKTSASPSSARRSSRKRWIGFAVFFMTLGCVWLVYASVVSMQVYDKYKEAQSDIARHRDSVSTLNLLGSFKSDNAIGATANYLWDILSIMRINKEIDDADNEKSDGVIQVISYRVYGAMSFVLSVLCFIGASVASLREVKMTAERIASEASD